MLPLEPHSRTPAENNGLLLLRLAIGLMILIAGVQKAVYPEYLTDFESSMADLNLPKEAVYIFFLFEIIAPLMVIFGVLSRLAAGILVAYMLIAIFAISVDDLFLLVPGRGHKLEAEFIYLLGSLAICCLGSGEKAMVPD